MTDEPDFIRIDGIRLEYRFIEAPAPGRPTLVFLHEGLGCVAAWRDFPDKLAAATGCGALVYSRQGYGRSDPYPLPRGVGYMHDEALNVLPRLIDRLEVLDHILIGHSDGGSIALIYAGGTEMRSLNGLILEAPHVFVEDISVKSIAEAKTAYEESDLRAGLAKYHKDVDNTFRGWNDIWLHPDFLHWNIEEFLADVRVPALAIQGRQDQYGTEKQIAAIEAQIGGPFEKLFLDDCRHAPHRDREDAALKAMTAFVEKQRG